MTRSHSPLLAFAGAALTILALPALAPSMFGHFADASQSANTETATARTLPYVTAEEAASGSGAPTEASKTAAQYVGDEACATCHDVEAERLSTTPHGGPGFAKISAHGCETCHGPGSVHAEDPDNPAFHPKIDNLSPAEQSATCQTCHGGDQQFFWAGSAHESRGLACQSCHSVHNFKSADGQLAADGELQQCLSCHKDVRAELWKTSHHPVREGKLACADCHNPHGSATPSMIRAASVNDQCLTCHAEKRGPMLWEHPPVRESCLNCHTPHGSNHAKLQKVSVPYLCQQCHLNTRHPGTLYDNNTLADASRASNRIFNRGCLNCHAAVHGSNHPSSPFLGH